MEDLNKFIEGFDAYTDFLDDGEESKAENPTCFVKNGYEPLFITLVDALNQAQSGKGVKCHARKDEPFLDQKIMEISRRVGLGGPAFQVVKKTEESLRSMDNDNPERAIEDLLGAINYAAAMILLIEERSK